MFKYLVTIQIWKGTLDTIELLDDILRHIGIVVDHDVLTGSRHHMITALISMTCREFAHDAYVELEDSKVMHVELDFYEPYLKCLTCFSVEHHVDSCMYMHMPRLTLATLLI